MQSLEHARALYHKGDLVGAQAICLQLIQQDPGNRDALYLLAVTSVDAGALDVAEQILTSLAHVDPSRADAFSTLGVVRLRKGDVHGSASPLLKALAIHPWQAATAHNLAPVLKGLGFDTAAEACMRRVLALAPNSADVLALAPDIITASPGEKARLLSLASSLVPEQHRFLEKALGTRELRAHLSAHLWQRLIALVPRTSEALEVAGVAALSEGYDRTAIRLLSRALALAPSVISLANLASMTAQQTGLPSAKSLSILAIAIGPDQPPAWEAAASVQDIAGRSGDSVAYWRRCAQIAKDPAFLVPLAAALRTADRLSESEAACRTVLKTLSPEAPAYRRAATILASNLRAQSRADAAVEAIALISVERQDPGNRVLDALTLPIVLSNPDEIAVWRQRLLAHLDQLEDQGLRLKDPFREVGQTAFHAAYHGLNDRPLQERIAAFYRKTCPDLNWDAPHLRGTRNRQDRIKIGFISRFMTEHTITKLMAGLMSNLDRDHFEVTILPFAGQTDTVTDTIAANVDHQITLPPDLYAARRAIAAKKLDILFYCDVGMDPLTYFLAFSRLARLQVVTWGHPVTTGMDTIDAFISAESIERPEADTDYSERLIRLPRLPAYYPKPDPAAAMAKAINPVEGLARVYSCPQSTFKYHPDFDAIWADILDKDRLARLVIVEGKDKGWDDILLNRFKNAHPKVAGRLIILPRLKRGAFFRLLENSAATLDPVHFGSGNTAYETFAIGTPIVTLPGKFMRGRVTDGCYHQMEVDALRAQNPEDYADKVVRLGTDADWRAHCKQLILDHQDALYDDMGAVRCLERALTALLEDVP